MLLLDEKPFEVPKEFLKKFVKQAVYELHSSQVTLARDKNGNLIKKFPRSIGIEPFYRFFQNGKMVELRYAENSQPKKIGGIHVVDYYPSSVEFRGVGLICDPTVSYQRELHYFLYNHPRRAGSPNQDDKKTAIFALQDLAEIAANQVSKRKLRNEIEAKILDVWSDAELLEMAFSFGDFLAKEKTPNEHRKFLLDLADKNAADFMKRAMAEEMPLRAKIVEGVNKKVLVLNHEDMAWLWGPRTGDRNGAEICRVRNGEDPKTRLIQYWNKAVKEDNIEYFYDKMKEVENLEAQEKEEKNAKRKTAITE